MSVYGERAALRSARTWLLLLCPEIPDRSGKKGAERLRLVVKAAGCLGGSQRRHEMAYGAAGKQHGVAGAYTRRNTQGLYMAGRRGLSLPELAPLSARVRARLALHAPTPAFGHRRSRPLADRGPRPPSTVDRGLRPPPQNAGSRSMLQLLIHESMNEVVEKNAMARCNTPNFWPYVIR